MLDGMVSNQAQEFIYAYIWCRSGALNLYKKIGFRETLFQWTVNWT